MRSCFLFYIVVLLKVGYVGSFQVPNFSPLLGFRTELCMHPKTASLNPPPNLKIARLNGWLHRQKQSGLCMALSPRRPLLTWPVRVAILGGGNFGLCLAVVLGNKNIPVTILVRKDNVAATINTQHHHPTFLSDVKLPLCVTATTDPAIALADAAFIIHAVPVQFSRAYLRSIKSHVGANTPIICTSKGIESGTLTLMKDILYEELGAHRELAFLSGPSFAREIATGLATAVVIASHHEVCAAAPANSHHHHHPPRLRSPPPLAQPQ